MLSFSNFGSVPHERATKVRKATDFVRNWRPDLAVEGEMHADIALLPQHSKTLFPFSRLAGKANVLIFPSLESGNIAQKSRSVLAPKPRSARFWSGSTGR